METPRFTNNSHCHSATRLYYWLIFSKKKYRTNNEEQYKFHPNYSTTGSKTQPKHNEVTTKTPSTTCTKSTIQNTMQYGYHTNNVQQCGGVHTKHSKRITDRKNTEEEEDAETTTWKETQTVKNDPAVVWVRCIREIRMYRTRFNRKMYLENLNIVKSVHTAHKHVQWNNLRELRDLQTKYYAQFTIDAWPHAHSNT